MSKESSPVDGRGARLLIRSAGQLGLADSVLVVATVDRGTIRLWDQVSFGEHQFGRVVEIAAYGHIFEEGDQGHTYELTLTGLRPEDIDDYESRHVDVLLGETESCGEEPLPGFR